MTPETAYATLGIRGFLLDFTGAGLCSQRPREPDISPEKELPMLHTADQAFNRFLKACPISRRFVAVLLVVLLALCLVPSLYVGRFVMPQADDFGFSANPHAVWQQTGSVAAVIAAAAHETAQLYQNWQGSYTACFLMYLQPGQFGEGWYSLTPWLLLGAWLLCTVLLCRSLRGWLGVRRVDSVLFGAALLLLQLLLVPYPNESWYWYNGSIYYTFFYAVTLGLLALLIRSHAWESRAAAWAGGAAFVALGAFLGGGPFSLILVALFLWGGSVWRAFSQKRHCRFAQAAGLLALCLGFAVNALCPGNATRSAQFPDTPGMVQSIYLAIVHTLNQVLRWTNPIVLVAALLLAPVLWRAAGTVSFLFRRPLIASILSFGLFAMMLCPPIYGMGSVGPQRLTNVIFFCYLWLVLFNFFYWLGWLQKRTTWSEAAANGARAFWQRYHPAVFVVCAFFFVATFTVGLFRENTPVSALKIALNGEGATYQNELRARALIYEDESIEHAVVPELTVKPFPIYHDDLSDDPTYFANGGVAAYYGKRSVTLQFR